MFRDYCAVHVVVPSIFFIIIIPSIPLFVVVVPSISLFICCSFDFVASLLSTFTIGSFCVSFCFRSFVVLVRALVLWCYGYCYLEFERVHRRQRKPLGKWEIVMLQS